jgi:hypothetical protein
MAAANPAGPPPTIKTSKAMDSRGCKRGSSSSSTDENQRLEFSKVCLFFVVAVVDVCHDKEEEEEASDETLRKDLVDDICLLHVAANFVGLASEDEIIRFMVS